MWGLAGIWVGIMGMATPSVTGWERELAEVRAKRLERLTSETGWLTLVGLFWLPEGESTVGSAAANSIVFPSSSPARVGAFSRHGKQVRFMPEADAHVTVMGGAVDPKGKELALDTTGTPSLLQFGTYTMHVIERSGKVGIRLKDKDAATRRDFKGLSYFPASARWRVTARLVPYPQVRKVQVPTAIGTAEEMDSPGDLIFSVDGKEHRLQAIQEAGDDELSFVFGDLTNGKDTYGAGRFIDAPLPKDGVTVLDFNRAYNPPCAFTPYATCPLPLPTNRLKLRVEAGEKLPTGH